MRTARPVGARLRLSINNATSWSLCETLCLQWLQNAPLQTKASTQACVFSTLSINNQDVDGTKQQYAVLGNPADVNNSSLGAQHERQPLGVRRAGDDGRGRTTAPLRPRCPVRPHSTA